jgi:hypothetical protein
MVVQIQYFDFGPKGGRRDKALPEDEAKILNSSWLHKKEAWHVVAV